MFKKLLTISLVALTVAGTSFISTQKAEAYGRYNYTYSYDGYSYRDSYQDSYGRNVSRYSDRSGNRKYNYYNPRTRNSYSTSSNPYGYSYNYRNTGWGW